MSLNMFTPLFVFTTTDVLPQLPDSCELSDERCCKSGCQNLATRKVVGSLTYYSCEHHYPEIKKLAEYE